MPPLILFAPYISPRFWSRRNQNIFEESVPYFFIIIVICLCSCAPVCLCAVCLYACVMYTERKEERFLYAQMEWQGLYRTSNRVTINQFLFQEARMKSDWKCRLLALSWRGALTSMSSHARYESHVRTDLKPWILPSPKIVTMWWIIMTSAWK
jgi:hypothetical protein